MKIKMHMDDMPLGIELTPGGRPTAGGGRAGFIPASPGLHSHRGYSHNAFPGVSQVNCAPPATAPSWPTPASPWGTSGWPQARYGYRPYLPYSPYTTTPAASWGEFTPASQGLPPTPGGGTQELTQDQPITTSWFNGAARDESFHTGWPADAGPKRTRKPSFHIPERSPRFVEDVPLEEETHSQSLPHPHTPGLEFGFGGASPSRSLSAGTTGRARSRSRGRMVGNVARSYRIRGLAPEEYDSDNLARRPRDWRPDYVPPRTFINLNIPRIQRNKSDVDEYKDPIKRRIPGTLAFNPSDLCVMYDLRYLPQPETLSFPHRGRPYNHIDFAQLAADPPVDRMRLFHPLLPWYIDVEQEHDNGVTVQDVIMQMHLQLQLPVRTRHYFNEKLGSETRERIARAFEVRAQTSEERRKGIKRVDYLEDRVVFVGLIRSRDGLWEMKTIA